MRRIGLNLFLVIALSGCPFSKQKKETTSSVTPESGLLERGKAVYNANCTACHNSNPKLPGSIGPDVYGSSKELLTARIVHGKYPDGYQPKRASGAMPALPHLSADIDALTKYLNSN